MEVIKNGCVFGSEIDIGEGSSGVVEGSNTYNRRKHMKLDCDSEGQEDGIASNKAASLLADKANGDSENSYEKVSVPNINSRSNLNGPNNALMRDGRKVVLKDLYQSLDGASDGGLRGCIRDALLSYLEHDNETGVKECNSTDSGRQGGPSKSGSPPDGADKANESNHQTTTLRCQRTFQNVISSEKFAALCKLMNENFHGIKSDHLFGLNSMHQKMKEGTYEHFPSIFLEDIEQIWKKLEGFGTEIISLARSLSSISRNFYTELVEGHTQNTFKDGKHGDSDTHSKFEQIVVFDAPKACSCRRCGEQPNGRNFLVCDACEDMYHVSCIQPPLEGIPRTSWYCTTCKVRGIRTTISAKGSGAPHENCVVCARLNAIGSKVNGFGNKGVPSKVNGFDSKGVPPKVNGFDSKGVPSIEETLESKDRMREILHHCKVCKTEVVEDRECIVCAHSYCPSKYYHLRCLTPEESKAYGPRWYCASCLCRSCLVDKDDDKIVLCDGCDHAYHIYCMKPPRNSIPQGEWFCVKCDVRNWDVHWPSRAYKKRKRKRREGSAYRKSVKKQSLQCDKKSIKGKGGMDMLLSAAKTLEQ